VGSWGEKILIVTGPPVSAAPAPASAGAAAGAAPVQLASNMLAMTSKAITIDKDFFIRVVSCAMNMD
jgi:hypothetical protein